MNEQTIIAFVSGCTYTTRSIVDSDHVIKLKVASRTPKTLTTDAGKVLRIGVYQGAEFVKPWGSYSMAPIVMAKDVDEWPVGTRYVRTRRTEVDVWTVKDIHKTYNAAGELVKTRYVASHLFLGQELFDYDVVAVTIARNSPVLPEA